MPDAAGTEEIHLLEDFPPVSTADWEALIRKDLKGADYEKRLVWRTEEGIAVRPYYRAEDLPAGLLRSDGNGNPWAMLEEFAPAPDAIRADRLHEAGANAVQELGYGIAAGVDRLAGLTETQPVDVAAGKMEFVFAVGSAYFVELAKLRAARMLWAQAVSAFAPADPSVGRMRLAVRTSYRNKSTCDRYTNLLRVTTESLSAVIGGCDELAVMPFGFDPHLGLNVQRILREESHLDAVSDPASGSYFIEALTAALAREAWKLFQQVESEGGYAKALASGSIRKALEQSRAAREKAMASRRQTLVGVNNYPNLLETEQEAAPPAVETGDDDLPAFRLAEPFEAIRARTARQAALTGKRPKVLLLKRGDLKMKTARANFCLNFFGCAGFDMTESEEHAGTDADLLVLCSSDAEYLALAREVCPQVSIPVIVAGNPKDQIDALKAAGVADFVHIQSDALRTLSAWQDHLGMRN